MGFQTDFCNGTRLLGLPSQHTRVQLPELIPRGCESVISGTPYPLTLTITVDGQVLNSTVSNDTTSNYSQTLSFKDGLNNISYTWSPENTDGVSFDIEYVVFASRNRPNIGATQLQVTPRGDSPNFTIIDLLDGRSAVRFFLGKKVLVLDTPSIFMSNHPDGLPNTEAFIVSTANVSKWLYNCELAKRYYGYGSDNEMAIGQEWDGSRRVFLKSLLVLLLRIT